MLREVIEEQIERITDKNCCWYEACIELLDFQKIDVEDYDLDDSAEAGMLYEDMLSLMSSLDDNELKDFAVQNSYI